MNPYLSFKGDCEAAFTFYARYLDGQPGPIFRYGGRPCPATFRQTGRTRSCTAA